MKFTTIADAKRKTGLSYLGAVAKSTKIAKGLKYNEQTYIIYLAPASASGYNVCPKSTPECREACLNESGQNRMDIHKNRINNSRIKKTLLFFEDREFFMGWVVAEIKAAARKAARKGFNFSVRLNGTSDIDPALFVHEGKTLFEIFPEVQFYDYTKVLKRFRLLDRYKNYDLTFSFSGHNMSECLDVLEGGKGRVAMVFQGRRIPVKWSKYKVIDGDTYDMRYKEETGVIVGLRFKKVRNKVDTTNNKFIIPATSKFSVY